MDEILIQSFENSTESIAMKTAIRSARANVLAKIVNLPEVLESFIKQIEDNEKIKEKMKANTESADIAGRRTR